MTKSSKIIITLLVVILVAVLGIGAWLITNKSEENDSVAIKENSANVANSENVTENTSVNNNNSSNQSQEQNQNANNVNSNNTSNTSKAGTSTTTNNKERTLTSEELSPLGSELNLSMYNGFINNQNTYTKPSEINLEEVFYNEAGYDNEITDEEIAEYKKIKQFYNTDMRKVTTEQIKTIYSTCTGEEIKDINSRLSNWVYLEKYDAYYMEAGDTNHQEVTCESGYVKADGVTYVLKLSNGCTTTIKVNPESYTFEFIFISNVVE